MLQRGLEPSTPGITIRCSNQPSYSTLIFLPYLVIIKVAGVRLPAHLVWCLSSGALAEVATLFIYSLSIMRLTLLRSSSSVSHFSMSSRIAFSKASVTFISVKSSLPFIRDCRSLPYEYYYKAFPFRCQVFS